MTDVTVKQFATVVGIPVDRLLEQFAEAGITVSGADAAITEKQKLDLLAHLRKSHGNRPAPGASEPKRITLKRKTHSEIRMTGGAAGQVKTVSVEVRKKRTYVKPEGGKPAMTPDEERADILRKLEESRARNRAEQEALEVKDRQRAEELAEIRRMEQEQAEAEAAQPHVQNVQYHHSDYDEALASDAQESGAQPARNAMPKVGRNDPCPCGSGKKYKQCHGKLV